MQQFKSAKERRTIFLYDYIARYAIYDTTISIVSYGMRVCVRVCPQWLEISTLAVINSESPSMKINVAFRRIVSNAFLPQLLPN